MASGHSVTDVDGRLTAKVSFAYTATLSISFLSRLLRNAQCQNYFCYFPLCEKCPKCSLTRGQWPYISALTRPKYATLITLVSMCILPPMASEAMTASEATAASKRPPRSYDFRLDISNLDYPGIHVHIASHGLRGHDSLRGHGDLQMTSEVI